MGHSINDVIQSYAEGHGRESLRVIWVVSPLPCIAQVHVMADGNDNTPLVVANSAPFGLISILFISSACPHKLLAGYLHLVVYIVESMEDFVAAREIFDRPIREHLSHAVHEIFPVFRAMKIIDHEKATFQQVLAQPAGFSVCK